MTYQFCTHDSCAGKFDSATAVSEVTTLSATEPEWTKTEQVPAGASYLNAQGKCVTSCEWYEKENW